MNVSTTRTTSAPASSAISGAAAKGFIGSMTRSPRLLHRQLALCDVLQQVGYRHMHQVGERLGIDAHPQHRNREQPEDGELACPDVLERRDVAVGDFAEDDALVHPQR